MYGSGLPSLAFNHVWQLQARYFPLRVCGMGSLQEPRKEDAVAVDKPGPHDNYSCYRLPATASPGSTTATPSPHTRDLYGVVREACAQQNVKWPVECQVIEDKVHHLEDWPVYPEAFYEATGTELRPQPVGDELGRVVYHYYPTSSVNYFSRSCVGGNKYLNDDVRPAVEDEHGTTLQFESRFECGNLGKAVQVSECYYELHLRADMYTSRHTQWFYFAVSNTRKDITYRFSIVNLTKGDSLYNHGLRPLMYSRREAEHHGVGWRRCATNIVYFKNHDSGENACFDSDEEGEDDAPSYTLTFNVTFPHDQDTVYIAHCYPYSYSDLQEHLLTIQNDSFKSSVCRQRILCRSLAGNPVYLLTITSPEAEDEGKKKRAVVLTARVHPGETPSSWIMKGVLDFLTADHPKAHELRNQFIFKVIPMLNPDGVVVGNHRCSLVGRDLNRQYKMVVKEMFPAIWHTKAMVRRLMDEHGVVMYGDFHAHSRKHNIFLYGCENRRNQDNHLREQIFPLLLHYNGGDKFSFRSCKFKVHRCKEGTARVVVWMMGVLHSYTMEASFGGASEGPRAGTHYNIYDFLSMGRQFCETLSEYFDPQPVKDGCEVDVRDLQESRGYLEGTTKSYMERMGELMATRLAISDTEEGSVSNFWESDHPSSRLLLPVPSIRRLEALEPVVAKTRLHDPRRPTRPLRPPPNLYSSVRAAHIIQRGTSHLQRSPLARRDNKYSDQMKHKKREKDDEKYLQCLQDDRNKDNKHILYCETRNPYDGCDNYLWVRGSTNVDPIELLNDPFQSGNVPYHHYSSQPSQLDMGHCVDHRYSSQPSQLDVGPCEDLLVSGEEVVLRLSVPPVPRVSSATSTSGEGTQGSLPPRGGSTRKSSKRVGVSKGTAGTRDVDEEQLCADIAACDTLFLDTFAQETPELIAARNLKGKVKKKKSVKAAGGARDSEKRKEDKPGKNNSEGSKEAEDTKKNLNVDNENEKVYESTQSDGKVKKKIKIVIGKKTKSKVTKKTSPEKVT
ncbi:cytosolic carboxypeptidase 2-like isoform X3 [Panulirus ornatus]|uniref:cytosolic carboxypeptidase 2-like isoform X3 n=1 Tax=Panulirus ornatus TaxID=150431 RepID=UPI003A84872F